MTAIRGRYGDFGSYASDDGVSRPFDPASTDPRMIVAIALGKRDGWTEIRPAHWADAGAVVKELKAKGQLVDRRARGKKL